MKPLVCRGAPRDMGDDEGAAIDVAALDLPKRASLQSRRALRDLRRHIPQQAERLTALAARVRVSPAKLLAELPMPRFCVGADGRPGFSGGAGYLRHSLPDAGIASVEWQARRAAPPALGLNAAGLRAVAEATDSGPLDPESHAPAVFLLAEVLQRFADARVAADWLKRRPASGSVRFYLRDDVRECWVRVSKRGASCRIDEAEPLAREPTEAVAAVLLGRDGIVSEGRSYFPSHQSTA